MSFSCTESAKILQFAQFPSYIHSSSSSSHTYGIERCFPDILRVCSISFIIYFIQILLLWTLYLTVFTYRWQMISIESATTPHSFNSLLLLLLPHIRNLKVFFRDCKGLFKLLRIYFYRYLEPLLEKSGPFSPKKWKFLLSIFKGIFLYEI